MLTRRCSANSSAFHPFCLSHCEKRCNNLRYIHNEISEISVIILLQEVVEDIVDIGTQDILNLGLVCYHHVCCFHVAFSTGKTVQGALKTAPVD